MGEKTCSIRTNEETAAKFKQFTENFDSSSACFQALLNAYEMQTAKKSLQGYQTSIEDFESHAQAIVKAYINALDINANTEERIKKDIKRELESKDKIIQELQKKNEENEKTIEMQKTKIEILTKEKEELEKELRNKKEIANTADLIQQLQNIITKAEKPKRTTKTTKANEN